MVHNARNVVGAAWPDSQSGQQPSAGWPNGPGSLFLDQNEHKNIGSTCKNVLQVLLSLCAIPSREISPPESGGIPGGNARGLGGVVEHGGSPFSWGANRDAVLCGVFCLYCMVVFEKKQGGLCRPTHHKNS